MDPVPPYEWDEEAAFAELEDLVSQDLQDSAEARALIEMAGEARTTVTISVPGSSRTMSLTVRAIVPYQVRSKIMNLQRRVQAAMTGEAGEDLLKSLSDPIEAQRPMYEVLALLCMEEPWTKWENWAVVDRRTGLAPLVLRKILEQTEGTEAKIGKFRRK